MARLSEAQQRQLQERQKELLEVETTIREAIPDNIKLIDILMALDNITRYYSRLYYTHLGVHELNKYKEVR